MPLPNVFNKFDIIVGGYDKQIFHQQRKFTSKLDEVYKLIDHEKGDIIRIIYQYPDTCGTSLRIEYLTTVKNTYGRNIIANRCVVAYNKHYIPKNALIHDMFIHERFLKYFKVCLRYNEPEIEVIANE